MTAVDVVIIGGGCVGTSTAFHLAKAGCTDVLLIEAAALASGSTSKAAGGIRMQHGDQLNVELAYRSLTEFENFELLTGATIDFHQVGYLFLLDSEDDLAMLRASAEMQRALGIPTEVLAPDAVLDHIPQLVTDDLAGATFCPLDGFAAPEAVVQGYAAAARRRGAAVRQGERALRIEVADGQVRGIHTEKEFIETRAVVCAAGVGSAELARTAGIDLPVHGERRCIWYSKQSGGLSDGIPLTIDFGSGFYFHREGPGLLFGGRDTSPELVLEPAVRRLPLLADLPIASSWSGDYEMSPDHNALVGESAQLKGFYYATGFSGHGFQLSPAIGEHLAELITSRPPSIDLTALCVERFAESADGRLEPITI